MIAFNRPVEKYQGLSTHRATGVQNGHCIKWPHSLLFVTSAVVALVTLALMGPSSSETTELIAGAMHFICAGIASFYVGVIAGTLTLSLHVKTWTENDKDRFWILAGSVAVIVVSEIVFAGTRLIVAMEPGDKVPALYILGAMCYISVTLVSIMGYVAIKENPTFYLSGE